MKNILYILQLYEVVDWVILLSFFVAGIIIAWITWFKPTSNIKRLIIENNKFSDKLKNEYNNLYQGIKSSYASTTLLDPEEYIEEKKGQRVIFENKNFQNTTINNCFEGEEIKVHTEFGILFTKPPKNRNKDNLKKLKGVGPKLEKVMNKMGFYFFIQIADLNTEKINILIIELLKEVRINRSLVKEKTWITQAKKFASEKLHTKV